METNNIKLSAVIVLYNPTTDNLKNIYNIIDSIDKIYVVDNSDDKNIRLKEENTKIEYIKLNKNMGVAYALNLGAKKSIENNFKYLLTLDQDSKINNSIIDKMKKFLNTTTEEKIGLISPYQDIGSNEEIPKKEFENMIEVMTSGNIIDLDAYSKIGGFKDWLFIDCVDTDYCMNLNRHGYKVLRLNNIVMKHNLGNVIVHRLFGKEYPCYNHNRIRRYYIMRNTLYINKMYNKYFPSYCKHLLRIQKGQIKRIIVFEKDKFGKLRNMFRGYRDFKEGVKGEYPYGKNKK